MKTYRRKIDTLKTMGHRLQQIRQEIGVTKQEISSRLLITPSAYHKYETGDRYPSIPVLFKMFKDLNLSMNWLLFGKDPMFLPTKDLETELNDSIQLLQTQLNEINKKHQTQEQKLITLSEENKSLKSELQNLEKENKTLNENLKTQETELQKLREENQTTGSPEFKELIDALKQNPLLYHEFQLQYQRQKMEKDK